MSDAERVAPVVLLPTDRNGDGRTVLIVVTLRDDRKRVFIWGADPISWDYLCDRIGKERDRVPPSPDDMIRAQGSYLERLP